MPHPWLLFLFSWLGLGLLSAQSPTDLHGYLVEYSSQRPLSGVNLLSRGSNPTATLSDGSFTLSYGDKQPGEKVFLIVNQAAYRVARYEHPVPVFLRQNPEAEPLVIELCREGQCPEDEIRREIMQGLQWQVDDLSQEIRQLPANSERVATLQDSLTGLLVRIQEMEGTIRDLSRQIARSEFGPALPVKQQAVAYLKRGLMDSAVYVLEQAEVKQNLRRIVGEEAKAQATLQKLQAQKAEHIDALLTLARSYALEYQRDSAVAAYQLAIQADTSQYEHRYEYAQYLKDLDRYGPAIAELRALLDQPLEPWQRGNALGYLAEIYLEQGRWPAAERAARQAMAQYDGLMAEDSLQLLYRVNRLIARERIAGIMLEQGQVDSAFFYTWQEKTGFEGLCTQYPADAAMQNRLATVYGKLSDLFLRQERLDSALRYVQRSRAMVQLLVDRDPGSEALKRKLALAQDRTGRIYGALGQRDAALHYLRAARALNQSLLQALPYDEGLRMDLAVTHQRLGGVFLAQGQLDSARHCFRYFYHAMQYLLQRNPQSEPTRYNLATAHQALGELSREEQQLDSALYHYRQVRQQFQQLQARLPDALPYQQRLGQAHRALAGLHEQQGHLDSAWVDYRRTHLIYFDLYQRTQDPRWAEQAFVAVQKMDALEHPPFTHAQRVALLQAELATVPPSGSELERAFLHHDLAWYQLFTGDYAAAEADARAALRLAPNEMAGTHSNLALALLLQGKRSEAKALYHRYAGQPYGPDQSWTDIFLADLADLLAAGVEHPDLARVPRWLD